MRYISLLLAIMLFSQEVMGVIPNPPSTLTAVAISSSQINLSWSDNSMDELWFIIERGQTITSFSQIGTTTLNSYSATPLSSNVTYYFRVCAYNLDGSSSYSNIAQATTFDIPPVAPSTLNAEAISNSSINLSWSDNSYNETGFVIERKTTGAFTTIGFSPQNAATYTNIGISPNTTYYYRVAAYNQYGTSAYSNIANATTPYLNYIPLSFNWQISTIDSQNDVGVYSSIACDSLGKPHVSYTDLTSGRLKYAYLNGSTWTTACVGTTSSAGYYTSMDLDNSNCPHISHYNPTNQDLLYTKVIESFGTFGTTSSIVDGEGEQVGRFSSLKLDVDENPNISYYDEKNKALKYAFLTGAGRATSTVDYDPSTSTTKKDRGRFSSLFLIEDSLPCMSYYDATDGDLRFAFWNTTTWGSVTIDTTGDVGQYSSMVGTEGTIHISYYDATNTNLKYAVNSSGVWTIWTLDTPYDVGKYTSIGIDGSNTVISYYDATNKDLKIAYGSGSTWGIQTIDSIGDVGMYSSLAINNGIIHIAYYDQTNGNLKYATIGTATAPNAPSNLVATALSSSTISLSWSDNSANEEGFIIERGGTNTLFSYLGTTTLATYTNTGLSSNTTYYYRVCAYNSYGTSSYSNIAQATTYDIPPIAPSNLMATATGSSTIDLSWSDNSSNELGFVIERGSTITAFFTIGTTTLSTYTNTGLLPNTTYYYRVCAWNPTGGSSSYSNIASATTSDIPPNPPSDLTASAISNSSISLSWFDNSSNELGFVIERGSTITAFSYLGTTSASTYLDINLPPNTTYYYQVASFNTIGTSSYSNIAFATTFLTTLYLSPPSFVIGSGSTSTIKVMIDNVVNMVGASIYLSFDPNVLEVSTITYGQFPSTETLFSSFNNASGTIIYSVALFSGSSTGSGTIANIEFRGKSSGTSSISFEVSTDPSIKETNLIDNNGADIPFSWQDAFSSSTIMGSLTGKVVSSICNTTFMEFAGIEVGLVGIGTRTTNGSSAFSFTNIPIGTHTLWADTYGAGSITCQIYVGTKTDIGTLTMIAGDTDDSGQVNLMDFYRLRTEFGSSAVGLESDFNHDGTVTLTDFYILRQNFGKTRALSITGLNDNVLLSIEPLNDRFEIKIANVSNLIAATIDLLLPLSIEPLSIEKGDFLSSFSILEEKITPLRVKYTLALLSSEISGTGTIAILKVRGAGNITIGSETKLMDSNGKWIPFKTSTITSASATVRIALQDSTIFINGTITAGISVFSNDTIGANIEILYPDNKLEVLTIKRGDFGDVFLLGTETGKITIIGAKLGSPTSGFFTLANITFKGRGAGTANLLFSLVDLRDSNNKKISCTALSGTITIVKYIVGDCNKDGEITFDDLMLITTHWKGSNTAYDIGPASGVVPNLVSIPDGIIDFEDLMVFCLMWNWKKLEIGNWKLEIGNWKLEIGNCIWIEREGEAFVIKYSGEPLLGGHIVLSVSGFSTITSAIRPFLCEIKGGRLVIDFAMINGFNGEIARVKADDLIFDMVDIRDMGNNKMNIEIKDLQVPTALLQSYPNPAANSCWIPFMLSYDSYVSLTIYNIIGQKVRTIEVGQKSKGSYTQKHRAIFWDLKNENSQPVSKGLYFYKINTDSFSQIKSLVVK